jgi:6-phosphogluconolactonase
MKSVEIRRADNASDVAKQAAIEIIATINQALKKQETFNIALTGGTVGILTLEVLGQQNELADLDLSKVHFWWGDERFVASESVDRNSNQARQALLDTIDVTSSNVHEFPSSDQGLDLETARTSFENELLTAFAGKSPKMDLTILGMGPDGHVASLFPGHEHNRSLIVSEHNSPKPPAQRLSMSMDLINNSERIIFVVSGIDKAEAISSVHQDTDCELPAAKVSAQGETLWIIDQAAGSAFWSC